MTTKVSTNNIVRLVHYVKIADDHSGTRAETHKVECQDLERGFEFSINGRALIESVDSADYFVRVEKAPKTKLAEIFGEVGDNVFTVEFQKQNGDRRVLRGYMVKRETGMGRSQVIDLDITRNNDTSYDNRLRQVDHRTLQSLIVGGVKYVVKS